MYYPEVTENENSRETVSQWYGYNHNYNIGDGQFWDMKNMSADLYPYMSPREPRTYCANFSADNMRGIYRCSLGTVWLDGSDLNYDLTINSENKTGTINVKEIIADDDGESEQTLIMYGLYILIFPLGLFIKLTDVTEVGTMWYKMNRVSNTDTEIYRTKISYCNADGSKLSTGEKTVITSSVEPTTRQNAGVDEELEEGDYWYDSVNETLMIYDADTACWVPMTNTYLRIDFEKKTKTLLAMGSYNPSTYEVSFTLKSTNAQIMFKAAEPEARNDGSDLQEGDCWVDTENYELYIYSLVGGGWSQLVDFKLSTSTDEEGGVITFSISEEILVQFNRELDSHYRVGDAVYMDTDIADINDGSIIQALGRSYLVVQGTIPGDMTLKSNGLCLIYRKMPEMDYVCVSNNRVWGCRYGYDDTGEMINELYACKLGDPTNWFCYAGVSTDSYSLSMADDGPFTGAIEYQGYPTFFRENAIYMIYGSYPAQYQLVKINARGVQEGCSKSLVIVNETLIYKSIADICAFDGSTPSSISLALGKLKKWGNAVAGASLDKLYISMKNEDGEKALFTYNMTYGLWHKEDDLDVSQFLYTPSGSCQALVGDALIGLGVIDETAEGLEDYAEDMVEWMAETGDNGYEYPDRKLVDKITIRCYVPEDALLQIWISYDDDDYQLIGEVESCSKTNTVPFYIIPNRCDHFRLKFMGHGAVRIYTLSRQLDVSSEEL